MGLFSRIWNGIKSVGRTVGNAVKSGVGWVGRQTHKIAGGIGRGMRWVNKQANHGADWVAKHLPGGAAFVSAGRSILNKTGISGAYNKVSGLAQTAERIGGSLAKDQSLTNLISKGIEIQDAYKSARD